jgi:hypothetical protein
MSEVRIFFISESGDYDDNLYGFAFSPDCINPAEIQNWDKSRIWQPIQFKLKDGDYADYIVNDLNIPLFSEKLKQIVLKSAKNVENISFYPVFISKGNENRMYYFLKLSIILRDVINLDKSVVENNTIMRPYFIEKRIEDIFRCDYDTDYLFVTEYLMNSILKEEISGINFYTWT